VVVGMQSPRMSTKAQQLTAASLTDNTNADPDTRAYWIKLAGKFGIPVRCILFTANAKLCEHNDTVRALNGITVGFSALHPELVLAAAARTVYPRWMVSQQCESALSVPHE